MKAVDGTTTKCKQCNSVLKTLGGSTKDLHVHLASKHNKKVNQDNIINLPGPSNINDSESEPPMKRKISHYFLPSETSSLDIVLDRMTALDGLPLNLFVNSYDLKQLLISKDYKNLPTSANTIRNKVVNYSL